ncbi:MAG: rod shape-determining protein MreC [Gemmatimonadota bacterium]
MAVLGGDFEIGGGRRQVVLAGVFVLAGIAIATLGEATQQRIAGMLRGSVLRPFVAMQEGLAQQRTRAGSVDQLRVRVDSLAAIVTTQSVLVEENETLRRLLTLSERLGPDFRSATALRPGTSGSESIFLLDVGTDDGVHVGAPIISPEGLVGKVQDAGASSSVGIDWTHPDFRASAMIPGADVYGIVENRRGAFREEDRLVLTGTAYNEVVLDGSDVVTSGLGGVYPRGIPIGTIDGVADSQGTWRKSYWLRPRVLPGSITHVLVAAAGAGGDAMSWPDDEDGGLEPDAVRDSSGSGPDGNGS